MDPLEALSSWLGFRELMRSRSFWTASFFMPALKHFLRRQYRHWFLLSLSTTQLRLNRHEYECFLRTDRRKNPLHPSQDGAP